MCTSYFKISVDDIVLMQVANGRDDLGGVETGAVLGEEPHARQVVEQLAAVDVLHDEAQAVARLEAVL